jgi:hypothetical protein
MIQNFRKAIVSSKQTKLAKASLLGQSGEFAVEPIQGICNVLVAGPARTSS